jgi:hypothetical protein
LEPELAGHPHPFIAMHPGSCIQFLLSEAVEKRDERFFASELGGRLGYEAVLGNLDP